MSSILPDSSSKTKLAIAFDLMFAQYNDDFSMSMLNKSKNDLN